MSAVRVISLLLGSLLFVAESSFAAVRVGAERLDLYLDALRDQRVAIFSNHTGVVDGRHTLDLLLEKGVCVTAIFSPEHGFRGDADAGEHISSSVDEATNVPILSLYDGNSKRPSDESMSSFDLLIVDIQDVGLRFYTYYIAMYYLMDACAEFGRQVVVFDRPNPNIHYVDGPLLDMKYRSGVGVLPIPVVYGMTIGELAQMINGEGWLPEGRSAQLRVIPCENYTRQTKYQLDIAPSPNLPNMKSIYLYPSTCLFEGSPLSLGRGTDFPFQVYGHPEMSDREFSFTPRSRRGALKPPHQDKLCYGVDLRGLSDEQIWAEKIDLRYIIDGYRSLDMGEKFFGRIFDLLIGQSYVREMIVAGASAEEIEAMWSGDVEQFMIDRAPYLIYPEE